MLTGALYNGLDAFQRCLRGLVAAVGTAAANLELVAAGANSIKGPGIVFMSKSQPALVDIQYLTLPVQDGNVVVQGVQC